MKKLALAIPVLLAGLFTLATPTEAHAQTVVVRGGGTVHVGGGVRVYSGGYHRHHHSHGSYYRSYGGGTYMQPSSITVTVLESVTNYEQVSVADWSYDYSCGRWVQTGSHLEWQWVTRNVQRRYTAYWYSNGYGGGYYGYYDGNGNLRIANR